MFDTALECGGARSAARPPDVVAAGIVIVWTLLVAGCADPAAVRPGEIRTYNAARPTEIAPPGPSVPAQAPGPDGLAGARPAGLRLRYEVPEGWTDRGGSGMRLATLAIGGGDEPHEVTVVPAAGTLRANVDRWLSQLAPGGTPESVRTRAEAAVARAEKVTVGAVEASVVLLLDEAAASGSEAGGEAILGAMIPLDSSASLFVKFKGPAAVARRERENFFRFVSSIRWN